MALRYFLLSTHYRSPLNYDDDTFQMYIREWVKLESAVKALFLKLDLEQAFFDIKEYNSKEISTEVDSFNLAMSDDFNTANAITSMQSLLKITNQKLRSKTDNQYLNELFKALEYMMNVLGLAVNVVKLKPQDRELYKEWQDARKDKDFTKADQLREQLTLRGIL
jgi:cysteinyl-tRNA synthetase